MSKNKKNIKNRMKLSDYFRLGRISIKARKKSTKNTVFGMSFGLILLVPMIFFAIAFYVDLTKQVNRIETVSSINVELKNINDKSESIPYIPYSNNEQGQDGLPAFNKYEELYGMNGVEDYILSEYAQMNFIYNSNQTSMLVGDESYDLSMNETIRYNYHYYGMDMLKIIFPNESSTTMFTQAEINDYKYLMDSKDLFLPICNDGFTKATRGKSEIIISEYLLKLWDIDVEDVANKVITIAYPKFQPGGDWSYFTVDNDNNPNNKLIYPEEEAEEIELYFVYKFKVVGIIDARFYDLPGKREESHFWVTAPSVYYKDGRQDYKSIEYSLKEDEDDYRRVLTFGEDFDTIVNRNKTSKYMLLAQGFVNKFNEYHTKDGGQEYRLNTMKLNLQIENFAILQETLNELNIVLRDAYADVPPNSFSGKFSNDLYEEFNIISMMGKILILVFSAIGGIILFTNLLNLLNTVRYSVDSRKNYIGVMRAIGAKSKIIPRLYIWEMIIIFIKTFIWVSIFSTAISYGIKFGLTKLFGYMADIASFTISFVYFPIALGGMFALTTFIGILFAAVSTRVVAYQPILATLHDEE